MRLGLALLVLLLIIPAALSHAPQAAPTPAGRWEGAVLVPGSPIRLVVDLAQNDHQWVGSIIAPDFGIKGTPLTALTVNGADLEFAWRQPQATFKGHLDSDGTLRGEYTQAGNKAPFLFKRIGDAQVDLPERSTLVGRDLQGEWTGSLQFQAKPLSVILKLPDSGTPTAPSGQFLLLEYNATFPVTFWKQDGNNLLFVMESASMTFEGEVHDNALEISGVIHQASFEIPLTLHRGTTNPAAAKPAAPATSK